MTDRATIVSTPVALDASLARSDLRVDGSGRLWTREGGPVTAPVSTTGTSAANTAQTVSTPSTGPRRVKYVVVAYSAAPTQAGVTVTLNSVAGAGFDTLLFTGTANARYTFYEPTADLVLQDGDTLDVAAPAGGVGITSSILIVSET